MLRDNIIKASLVLKIPYQTTNILLVFCRLKPLYARNRRDSIFIWALSHKVQLSRVNSLLDKYHCRRL